jgi:putative oxidoreductase
MTAYVFLAGRILYALPLIIMGSSHFMQMAGMTAYATAKGIPAPQVAVIVSGLVIIVGAIFILMGYRGRIGAWLVAAFLVATAFLMHGFWAVPAEGMQMEMINFFKNLIMAGAAIMMTKTGTGPYSIDNLRKQ